MNHSNNSSAVLFKEKGFRSKQELRQLIYSCCSLKDLIQWFKTSCLGSKMDFRKTLEVFIECYNQNTYKYHQDFDFILFKIYLVDYLDFLFDGTIYDFYKGLYRFNSSASFFKLNQTKSIFKQKNRFKTIILSNRNIFVVGKVFNRYKGTIVPFYEKKMVGS